MKEVAPLCVFAVLALHSILSGGCSRGLRPEGSGGGVRYAGSGTVVDTEFAQTRRVRKPWRVHRYAEAIYPDSLIKGGLKDTVYVNVCVDNHGKVLEALIINSNTGLFNQSAIDAALKWEFSRYKSKGEMWRVLRFHFGPIYWVE